MLKERCHLSDDAVAGLGRGVALPKAWLGILSVATLTFFVSLPVRGQGYPVKPVTFITPAAAGNSPDVVTRLEHAPGSAVKGLLHHG